MPKPEAPKPEMPKPEPKKAEQRKVALADREALRRRAAFDLARWERRIAAAMRDVFEAQERRVMAALEAAQGLRKSDDDLPDEYRKRLRLIAVERVAELVPSPDDSDRERMERIIADLLQQRGEEALSDLSALTDATIRADIKVTGERAARYLSEKVERVFALTTQTTTDAVRDALSRVISDGGGFGDMVAAVQESFQHAKQSRAQMIARTEATGAYNFASQEAWAQSGVVEEQEWLSSRDDAVRESHAMADGTRAPLGGVFSVGGAGLQFPGDPSGPPGETVNCRCTLLPVIAEPSRQAKSWWAPHANGNGHVNRVFWKVR